MHIKALQPQKARSIFVISSIFKKLTVAAPLSWRRLSLTPVIAHTHQTLSELGNGPAA